MNPLHLSGYGVKVKVDNMRPKSELVITDGRQDFKEGAIYRFRPRKIPHDSIIIDGHSGYISLQAFHWLSKNKIAVFILNFDGTLISSTLPPMPVKADLRAAQLDASRDAEKTFKIFAHTLSRARIHEVGHPNVCSFRRHDYALLPEERHRKQETGT